LIPLFDQYVLNFGRFKDLVQKGSPKLVQKWQTITMTEFRGLAK
jgi:hypothetical protein